jgi:cell wall-associated NlpC family hydrolase
LGFDCSGYLQYVFALCDRRLPRDASQQAQVGVDVEEGAWQRGDLLFFGEPVDHVAMLVGEDRILHCSARVREERLGENPQLRGRLCAVRRVFDAATDLGESWWAGRDAAHRT